MIVGIHIEQNHLKIIQHIIGAMVVQTRETIPPNGVALDHVSMTLNLAIDDLPLSELEALASAIDAPLDNIFVRPGVLNGSE